MPEITNPRELFLHELGDILYVEQKLADEVLPKLIGEVTDGEFRDGLEGHLRETRGHVENVKQVFAELGETPKAEPCLGFEGLKKEHDKLKSETSRELIDSVDLLDKNLAQEKEALRLVEKIATRVGKESAKALA